MTDSTNAPSHFARTLKSAAEKQAPERANVTFVLGAGFSNAWDSRYPIGNDLFDFSRDDWMDDASPLDTFLHAIHFRTCDDHIDRAAFLDIVYQVGMLKKYPLIRPRYVDDFYLQLVERELRYLVLNRFIRATGLSPHGDTWLAQSAFTSEQVAIGDFFSALRGYAASMHSSSSARGNVGVSFITTNYDFVIEAIFSASGARDDARSLYRGFTPLAWCGDTDWHAIVTPDVSGQLLKINGGFEIFPRQDDFEIDYRPRAVAAARANPPEIMLPSRAQDYDRPYFQALFPKAVRLLRETRIVVLVGYSFPEEDALIRLLLRQFAEAPNDGRLRALYYIDLEDTRTQRARATAVFPHASEKEGLAVIPWQGSFSEWCRLAAAGLRG